MQACQVAGAYQMCTELAGIQPAWENNHVTDVKGDHHLPFAERDMRATKPYGIMRGEVVCFMRRGNATNAQRSVNA